MNARNIILRLTDTPDVVTAVEDMLNERLAPQYHEKAAHAAERYITAARREGIAYNDGLIYRAFVSSIESVEDYANGRRRNGDGDSEPILSTWTPLDFEKIERNGIPPIEWLVPNWIIKHDVFVIAGDAGVGKSTLFSALAYGWASGTAWVGIPVPKLRVLYIDEEQSDSEVYGLFTKHGPRLPGSDLRVFVQQGANLDSDAGLEVIEREVAAFKPDVLLIDSATQAFGKAAGNNNEEIGAIFGRLFQLRARHGVTTGFLHHLGKPGEIKRSLLHRFLGTVAYGTQASAAFGAIPNDADSIQLIAAKRRLAPKPSMIVGYREIEGRAFLENRGQVENSDGATALAAEWAYQYLIDQGVPAPRASIIQAGKAANHTEQALDHALRHLKKLKTVDQPLRGWYEAKDRMNAG